MYTIKLFPEKTMGPVKDVHGVGGGPVTQHFVYDATEDFREAGIPYCRTHDIEYPFGSGEFVDIHCVFRDFNKDENDPQSYNFTFTDEYLKAIVNAGAKPFYRLGSTIEHQPIKLYVNPPQDNEKWGRICSHIISHYNEGWANGFFMGVEYWEIWNEPDIGPCWTGTAEQFIELYAAAAAIIKRDHPGIKVGGCAFADPLGETAEKWLKAVKERALPMDFFSWHAYVQHPRQVTELSSKVDALLRKYGFEGKESIFNEWNYVCSWTRDLYKCYELHTQPFECAFMAAAMSEAQNSSIEKAMYYEAQMVSTGSWNGVFGPAKENSHAASRRPERRPGYYALKSWNELKQCGVQIYAECDCPDAYITAAKAPDGNAAVLISYFNDKDGWNRSQPPEAEFRLDIQTKTGLTAFITDEGRCFMPVKLCDGILRLKGNSCALIKTDGAI